MALNGIITEDMVHSKVVPGDDVIVVEDLWRTYDMGSEQQEAFVYWTFEEGLASQGQCIQSNSNP